MKVIMELENNATFPREGNVTSHHMHALSWE